jgi:hypothetical protein
MGPGAALGLNPQPSGRQFAAAEQGRRNHGYSSRL